jgi:hypothetical protein
MLWGHVSWLNHVADLSPSFSSSSSSSASHAHARSRNAPLLDEHAWEILMLMAPRVVGEVGAKGRCHHRPPNGRHEDVPNYEDNYEDVHHCGEALRVGQVVVVIIVIVIVTL